MAELERDAGDANDPSLQLFDFETYFGEGIAEPEITHDVTTPGLSSPRYPDLMSRLERVEPDLEQVDSSEIATTSQTDTAATTHNRTEPLGGPTQQGTMTGIEPLPQYAQQSRLDTINAEISHVEDEIEELNLHLRKLELLRRLQELHSLLPAQLQAQTTDHSSLHNLSAASESNAQLISKIEFSDKTDRRHSLSVSTVLWLTYVVKCANDSESKPPMTALFNTNSLFNSDDANIGPSGTNSCQMSNDGIDFQHGASLTSPSYFGVADLSSNAHGGPSHTGFPQQSGRFGVEPSSLDYVHLPRSMSAGHSNSASENQYGMQGPILALWSDQTTVRLSSSDLQQRHGLIPEQHAMTLSTSQNDQPVSKSDMNKSIRKRPRTPPPTKAQRLSAVQHQLAKRTGVPEISLVCFDTEPRAKRHRTSDQRQNKKDVENVGGSCFLCLVYKKKVFPSMQNCVSSKRSLIEHSLSAPVNGPVTTVDFTGRNVSTIQLVSCGPVTSGQI